MARKNAAVVATMMRRAIEDGEYQRFERLPSSREMAESFGVARNTLREALNQLQKEGLLETRAGSGTYVTTQEPDKIPAALDEAAPLELIDARFALEPHICRLCVLHGKREDWERLEELCALMEAAVNDPAAFAEADTVFHRALVEATRNTLLIWLISQITAVRTFDEWTRMRQLTLDKDIIQAYNTQHRAVVDAIRSREPERAAANMKEHLETARLSLMRAAEA
ncbi:MAG: FadR/GntR family transcriptional regulator [Pseudomonadota bacterium]